MNKLKGQVRRASPERIRLAAQAKWLLNLLPYPKDMGGNRKRSQIKTIWKWSGSSLPKSGLLRDDGLGGEGAVGALSVGIGTTRMDWRLATFDAETLRLISSASLG